MVINILITCVGGDLMPYLIQYLKRIKPLRIRIIGTDIDINAVGKYFCDKFYKVPKGSDSEYIKYCIRIIKDENISLIIPTSDEEALSLSKYKNKTNNLGANLACIDYEILKKLNDKSKTYEELENKSLPVASWDNIVDFDDLLLKIRYFKKEYGGLVLKPKQGRGSKDIYIFGNNINLKKRNNINYFNNEKILLKTLEKKTNLSQYIIMKELNNPVIDLDMLSWKGKAISIIPRRRIDPAFPNMGHKIMKCPKLVELGHKLIDTFNLSWLYDCDIMYDDDKNPSIIEINPRQSGSIAVSIAAGYKIFDNLLNLHLNKTTLKENTLKEKLIIPFKDLKETI